MTGPWSWQSWCSHFTTLHNNHDSIGHISSENAKSIQSFLMVRAIINILLQVFWITYVNTFLEILRIKIKVRQKWPEYLMTSHHISKKITFVDQHYLDRFLRLSVVWVSVFISRLFWELFKNFSLSCLIWWSRSRVSCRGQAHRGGGTCGLLPTSITGQDKDPPLDVQVTWDGQLTVLGNLAWPAGFTNTTFIRFQYRILRTITTIITDVQTLSSDRCVEFSLL